MNPFDLSGKVALVTGANTGLGQGMALALAEAGASICLIGRSEPTETLQKLNEMGVKSHSILTDLGQAAFARHLVAAKKTGKIINIASMLTFQGGIRVPSYTASKSGVGGLTKALANEWAQHGINVNAIAPGYFATNNTAALQADEKRNSEILGRIPSGRWGDPSDMGGAVVFLAAKASDYVQGITLPVDGGWLSR